MLKIDLHTHTSRYSSCSRLSPGALCEIAMQRGLDALVITEHHHQWPAGEIAALQARYPALKLYAGVEISCTDGHDYVVLGLDGGPYVPHPMSYRRLQSLLARHPGAFVFVAHPFRYSAAEDGLAGREIDGIEVGGAATAAIFNWGMVTVGAEEELAYLQPAQTVKTTRENRLTRPM